MNVPAAAHTAIVLAAGESRRLGRPKQLLEWQGVPLLRRAVQAALSTSPRRLLVVVGAHADEVFECVADLPVERVDCVDWKLGMGASLRAGLRALHDDCSAALVLLCDQPRLAPEHLAALLEAWSRNADRAAASRYADTLGVPAVLPRSWFGELSGMPGDRGARELLRARVADVTAVDAPELGEDVDSAQDLARLDAPRESR